MSPKVKALLDKILSLPEKDQVWILSGLQERERELRAKRIKTSKCGWCKRPAVATTAEEECQCL